LVDGGDGGGGMVLIVGLDRQSRAPDRQTRMKVNATYVSAAVSCRFLLPGRVGEEDWDHQRRVALFDVCRTTVGSRACPLTAEPTS